MERPDAYVATSFFEVGSHLVVVDVGVGDRDGDGEDGPDAYVATSSFEVGSHLVVVGVGVGVADEEEDGVALGRRRRAVGGNVVCRGDGGDAGSDRGGAVARDDERGEEDADDARRAEDDGVAVDIRAARACDERRWRWKCVASGAWRRHKMTRNGRVAADGRAARAGTARREQGRQERVERRRAAPRTEHA